MRLPLPLTLKIAQNIVKHRMLGTGKFATVLQLEPLHACNLACAGCGRIREYASSIKEMMPLKDCLAAAQECGAPMVSICGGEPLIYPQIEELVTGLRQQRRIVYLCTNALLMRRKMKDYLAAEWAKNPDKMEPLLDRLEEENLVSTEDAIQIRNQLAFPAKHPIRPSQWFYWNVHIDGLEATHDRIVERRGVFRECTRAIRMAKLLGFQVATNTTVYKETDMSEIEDLFVFLGSLGVDAHTLSPGFDFGLSGKDVSHASKQTWDSFFLSRADIIDKFWYVEEWSRRFPLLGTPEYFEFLAGKRELACSAWAIPTRNVQGWRGPCYLIADAHYSSYSEMLRSTEWSRYGADGGKPRDPRCEHCMVHCGYGASGSVGGGAKRGDLMKNIRFNFAPRPRTQLYPVRAFNGKPELAGAKP